MRDEEGDPIPPVPTSSDRGPAKWAAVGALAGAAAVGLAWVTVGRSFGPAPVLTSSTAHPEIMAVPPSAEAPARPIVFLLAEPGPPAGAGSAPTAGPPTVTPAPEGTTVPPSTAPAAAPSPPIPSTPPPPSPAPSATGPASPDPAKPTAKINLNTATVEELDLLPGVGRATAQAILEYRTRHGKFRTVSELDKVPGIGPAKLDRLRPLVRAD